MKKHTWKVWVLIIILTLNFAFLVHVQLYAPAWSLDSIKIKFEPWLWEKLQQLEANGTSRSMPIIVSVDCSLYKGNEAASHNFKKQIAALLASEYNATISWIGWKLSFLNVQIMSTLVKKIAAYRFVDGLGDGERVGHLCLYNSTSAIRSDVVINTMGYNGSGVRVAVLDSGIDPNHPDLKGKIAEWKDFVNGNASQYDDNGHGTHCAGIVASTGQASGGIYRGVAPGVSLIIGKIADRTGDILPQKAVAALDWAVNRSAQIISCSFGFLNSTCKGDCQVCRKADECVSKGVVVVAMVGNKLFPGDTYKRCPGSAFNVITVGAVNDLNTKTIRDDTIADFSLYGPTNDGRTKPDVVAPGVRIVSCRAVNTDCRTWYDTYISQYYVECTGTSQATPHVAGVAALILQAHPTWNPTMVKHAIKSTAILNDNLQAMPEKENARGKGIVDASRAVSLQGMNIPADQAETKYQYGYGSYTATAYLNGTYEISAGSNSGGNYAIATLNKTFIPEHNSTNPTFLFTFHDIGFMGTMQAPANLSAIFKLFAPDGTKLFTLNQQIHYIIQNQKELYINDSHTINYTYLGTLYAQQTYKIEYGFSTYAYDGSCTIFVPVEGFVNGKIVAEWIGTIDGAILGPGNPSFEERLGSVYEVPYWQSNNPGWRELRGDINGDGKANILDLVLVQKAYGSKLGDSNWNPKADLNGDLKVDILDYTIVFIDFGKEANRKDGFYSWYSSGGGDYDISQWLCDHDVNVMKGNPVNFTFWFKPETVAPNGTQNYARAEICYIFANGTTQTINGNWVYPTQIQWYTASITTTIPADIIAIKIIIHGTPNFKAWIDKTSITIT